MPGPVLGTMEESKSLKTLPDAGAELERSASRGESEQEKVPLRGGSSGGGGKENPFFTPQPHPCWKDFEAVGGWGVQREFVLGTK